MFSSCPLVIWRKSYSSIKSLLPKKTIAARYARKVRYFKFCPPPPNWIDAAAEVQPPPPPPPHFKKASYALVIHIPSMQFPVLTYMALYTVYQQNTNIERIYEYASERRASELGKCLHFHILKLLFPSIYCWYFWYFISEHIYFQVSNYNLHDTLLYHQCRSLFLLMVWRYIYKRQYTDKTLTLKNSMYMRASGASKLRKFSHFYILKLLFLSIFCWYFRYFTIPYKWFINICRNFLLRYAPDKIAHSSRKMKKAPSGLVASLPRKDCAPKMFWLISPLLFTAWQWYKWFEYKLTTKHQIRENMFVRTRSQSVCIMFQYSRHIGWLLCYIH